MKDSEPATDDLSDEDEDERGFLRDIIEEVQVDLSEPADSIRSSAPSLGISLQSSTVTFKFKTTVTLVAAAKLELNKGLHRPFLRFLDLLSRSFQKGSATHKWIQTAEINGKKFYPSASESVPRGDLMEIRAMIPLDPLFERRGRSDRRLRTGYRSIRIDLKALRDYEWHDDFSSLWADIESRLSKF